MRCRRRPGWRPDGSINLEQLFAPATPEPRRDVLAVPCPDAGSRRPPPTIAGEPDWTVKVGGVELTNAAIAFEDRAAEPVKKFDLAPVNLRLSRRRAWTSRSRCP